MNTKGTHVDQPQPKCPNVFFHVYIQYAGPCSVVCPLYLYLCVAHIIAYSFIHLFVLSNIISQFKENVFIKKDLFVFRQMGSPIIHYYHNGFKSKRSIHSFFLSLLFQRKICVGHINTDSNLQA